MRHAESQARLLGEATEDLEVLFVRLELRDVPVHSQVFVRLTMLTTYNGSNRIQVP